MTQEEAMEREAVHHEFKRLQATLDAKDAEIARLTEALKPFADHLDKMRFDRDNHGNPLPDSEGVGWVYLTNGDFRRAAAAIRESN